MNVIIVEDHMTPSYSLTSWNFVLACSQLKYNFEDEAAIFISLWQKYLLQSL